MFSALTNPAVLDTLAGAATALYEIAVPYVFGDAAAPLTQAMPPEASPTSVQPRQVDEHQMRLSAQLEAARLRAEARHAQPRRVLWQNPRAQMAAVRPGTVFVRRPVAPTQTFASSVVGSTEVQSLLKVAPAERIQVAAISTFPKSSFTAQNLRPLFDVAPTTQSDGSVGLKAVLRGPEEQVQAIREAVNAGDVMALSAAADAVIEAREAFVAENPGTGEVMDAHSTLTTAEARQLVAHLLNPAANPIRMLDFARVVQRVSPDVQRGIAAAFQGSNGLRADGDYEPIVLSYRMSELRRAAKELGFDKRLLFVLEENQARLGFYQGQIPGRGIGQELAASLFTFNSSVIARVDEYASPVERAELARQLVLLNALGLMALQPQMYRSASQALSVVLLRNFVDLRSNTATDSTLSDASVGSWTSPAVSAASASPSAGDDGQPNSGQSWN